MLSLTCIGCGVQVCFAVISASTFLGLSALCYSQYGYEFVEHTYLHHFTRQDFKHSFSTPFYSTYLGMADSLPACAPYHIV